MFRYVIGIATVLALCVSAAFWWSASADRSTDDEFLTGIPAAESNEQLAPESDESTSQTFLLASTQIAKKRPIEVLTDGYVSSSACTRCHRQQHESWYASFHRTMTQVVSKDTAPKSITISKVHVAGDSYVFDRQGDRFFVTFDDPIDPGQQAVKRELVMITGSHHMNVFWYESPFDRTPSMLPIVYLLDQQHWIPRKSSFIRPPGPAANELGRWNDNCSRCHSTHPRGRLNSETREWDTHVGEFGIACEACHGPGESHIKFHDGESAVTDKRDVVVNPEELSHDLQSDVCAQCHSFHFHDFDSYDVDKFLTDGMPFRPGDDLENSPLRKLVRSTPEFLGSAKLNEALKHLKIENAFWSDGTVRVSGREYSGLIESPCHQNGKLSCLSCHEMHPDEPTELLRWKNDQLKPGMRTNKACTQCHRDEKFNDNLVQHTHHAVDSHGSQCMNCHMPHTTYGLLKSIRSHRIESPSVMTTLQTARPNGCVLCHLDRDIGWAADRLSSWYGQPKLELKEPIARETASAAVSFLLGDAGLRAIYASTFAWGPAQEASGTDWMPPYLLIGMLDDYDAVRIICKRTLKTITGWEDIEIDEFASTDDRAKVVSAYLRKVNRESLLRPRPALLIDKDGKFQFEEASRMFNARDRRPINLEE